jgi:hypothetical protein
MKNYVDRMKIWSFRLFLSLWLLLVTARCATTTPQTPQTESASKQPSATLPALTQGPVFESSPSPGEEGTPAATSMATPASPAFQSFVEQAIEDLAGRLAIDPDQITLLEAQAVVWPDSSFGCPKPGMAYTQVQQEGALIRLAVGDQVYDYHIGAGGPPFLCEQPLQVP